MKRRVPCLLPCVLLWSLSVLRGGEAAALPLHGGTDASQFQGILENAGQLKGPARYYAVGERSAVYFENDAVLLDHGPSSPNEVGAVIRVEFPAAQGRRRPQALRATDYHVNVFLGCDPKRWHTRVRTYGEVRYEGIAPGADLVYRFEDGHLEYDVVLAPRARLSSAVLRYLGADQLEIDRDGSLVIHTAAGEMREAPPRLYQEIDGERHWIAGGFHI